MATGREGRGGGSQIPSIKSVSHVLPRSVCTDWYAEPRVIFFGQAQRELKLHAADYFEEYERRLANMDRGR